MLSALIPSEHSYRAVLLAEELVDQRFVHQGPLVLLTTSLKYQRLQKIGDQPVSRMFCFAKPRTPADLTRNHAEMQKLFPLLLEGLDYTTFSLRSTQTYADFTQNSQKVFCVHLRFVCECLRLPKQETDVLTAISRDSAAFATSLYGVIG